MFLSPQITALIDLAIEEDFGRGDPTSESIFSVEDTTFGCIMAKQSLVLAGCEVAQAVFRRVDARVQFDLCARDGDRIGVTEIVAQISGPTRGILAAERPALNFLQRLSGIATLTRKFVDAVAGTRALICDTRKTAPGWRALDKLAVLAGGGHNHRVDLASGILIKDNHIAAAGSIRQAIERARAQAPHTLRIEVEVTSIEQIDEALAAGAEIVLLDNFATHEVRAAVARIGDRARIEISGGVTLDTVTAFADAGAQLISVGALTHSAPAVDLSLEINGPSE